MVKTRSRYKKVKSLFGKYERILEDWDLKKLEKVGKIIGGGTPDSTNMAYWNGEILWAIPTDITKLQTNQIENTERKITKEGLDSSSAKLLPKGTILITSRATIGECAIATKPISTNQGFQSIICDNNNFDRMYIFYSIKYHKNELLRLAYGTTFLEINKSELKKIMFSIPSSILEQQKIASILSGVDALIESTQHIIEKTERLKKGLMQKLLTKGISHTKFKKIKSLFNKYENIPKEWEIRTFEQLFEFLKTGTNSRSDLEECGEIGYIHYGDIHTKWNSVLDCSLEEIPFIATSKVEKLPLLEEGDLIIADASEDHEGSGASILLKNVKNRKIVSGLHTIALRSQDKNISPEFKRYLVSIKFVKNQIIAYVSGISVYGLSKNNLKIVKIPLPSFTEQQKIASILSGVDARRHRNIIALIILRIKLAIFLILFVGISVNACKNILVAVQVMDRPLCETVLRTL